MSEPSFRYFSWPVGDAGSGGGKGGGGVLVSVANGCPLTPPPQRPVARRASGTSRAEFCPTFSIKSGARVRGAPGPASCQTCEAQRLWIPACAGMTSKVFVAFRYAHVFDATTRSGWAVRGTRSACASLRPRAGPTPPLVTPRMGREDEEKARPKTD